MFRAPCSPVGALSLSVIVTYRGAPASFAEEEQLSFETSKGVKVINSFEGMGIRDALLRGVYAFGFEKPSAIQQRAIVPISAGAPGRLRSRRRCITPAGIAATMP